MLCVILAYASLLPRARWQGDEYIVFAFQRAGGWRFFLHWYLTWSPRLVSNAFFGLYGLAVLALHRPLACSCMAILWAGLGAACVLPTWHADKARLSRLLGGLALFALFLAGHSVTEVFYWPGGGLSYIPTLAGVVWLFWLLLDGLGTRPWRHAAAGLALVMIAGSSEVGIFIALSTAACLGALQIGVPWRRWSWLLPGVVVAAIDLALVLHGRVGTIEDTTGDPALLHHAGAALLQAIPAFAGNLVHPEFAGGANVSIPLSVASRILILAGARWSFGNVRAPGRLLPAFGVALLLAAFASVASAYYQFGRLCCTRHDTMRACLVVVALVTFGAAWPRWRPNAGAACLAGAVLLLFLPAAPSVLADYRGMNRAIAARARTWESGASPGPSMVFEIDPPGRLINAIGFTPGTAAMGTSMVWWEEGILRFFGKSSVVVETAREQGRK